MTAAIVRRFQQAVEKEEDTRKMKDILGMVPKDDLMNWTDDHGMDLLHHCILQNNAEAVDFLLKQGYFVRPHEPQVNPYVHLAAFLGLRTTLTVLLQHRPDDFRIAQQGLFVPPGLAHTGGTSKRPSSKTSEVSISSMNRRSSDASMSKKLMDKNSSIGDPSRKGKRGSMNLVDGLTTDGSQPLLRTPLEVAARAKHVECVQAMLTVCVLKAHPDAPNKGYLSLAALADCPAAMNLLLEQNSKQDKQTTDDYRAAVEICVQRVRPECLDLLLSHKPANLDIKLLFKQINFFHVLYTFSASFGKGAYGRLPEATRVLIKWGHNVNARSPPRTYPLYTLLTHAFCFHDYSFTQHYVECLRLLLKQGADPNFDEIKFEKRLQQTKGTKFVAGRNSFSSALHCLLETVEAYATSMASKTLAVRFVEDCAEVLFHHRADVTKVGVIGDGMSNLQGNVLHQYAKTCVTLGVDQSIMRCILRFGAEPDVKVNGQYAINVYFDKLFELFSRLEVVDTRHKYEDDVNRMLRFLCTYMTSAHIKEAAFIFKQTHGRSRSEQVKYYIDKVLDDLETRSKRVRPLQGLAAWKVWKLCGKRADIVRNLPVKVELKTMILPAV